MALNEDGYLSNVNRPSLHPSAGKNETDLQRNPNISIPIKQRRDKPSIYRKLFASPANIQKEEPIIETNFLVNVPTSLPFSNGDLAEQRYQRKTVDCPSHSLRKKNPRISEEYSNPRGKLDAFSPSIDENQEHRSRGTESIGDEKLISIRSTIYGPENASGGGVWIPYSAGTGKSARFTNSNAYETSTRSLQSLENSTIGSASKLSGMGDFKHLSLVAAASASLDSKLRRKALENDSAFTRIKAFHVKSIKNPPIHEQNILIPAPVRLAVDENEGFVSRHRQIMHEALVKSRDHAQLVLLDAEVSMYTRNIDYLRKYEHDQRFLNPLAKVFNEGDEKVSAQLYCNCYNASFFCGCNAILA